MAPKKFTDIHPTLREMLACHEVLRRMGVPSANIYAGHGSIEGVESRHFVQVVDSSEDRLTVTTPGDLISDKELFLRLWSEACVWWNDPDVPDDQRTLLCLSTTTFHSQEELAAAVVRFSETRPHLAKAVAEYIAQAEYLAQVGLSKSDQTDWN